VPKCYTREQFGVPRSEVELTSNQAADYLALAICAGDGCLGEAAPGGMFCYRCIRSKAKPVRDYKAKVEENTEAMLLLRQARLRPRLYAVASGQAVKFGITTNIKSRASDLQVAHPEPLVWIGHIGCDRQLERDVHALCSAERMRGEWFRREGTALVVEHYIAKKDSLAVYRLVGRLPEWMR